LYENALQSAKLVQKVSMLRTKKKESNRNPWFTESCRDLHNTVKNYEKLVNKYPQNTEYRHKFYSFRSKFRRLCKFEETKYKGMCIFSFMHNI